MPPKQFPNLNALRFFAAFAVIVHHVEQIKSIYNIPSFWGHTFIFNLGKQGVVLFFVLSGFLITYLLLREKKKTGGIDVRAFYVRRILKIWPLYFLIIGFSIFAMPYIPLYRAIGSTPEFIHHALAKKLALFVFFLPNLLLALGQVIPGAAQTWSIGTEEQFYIFWPWIIKSRINKYFALMSVLSLYLIIKYALPFLPSNYFVSILKSFWDLFNIDCMAIGGLFALLFYKRARVLDALYDKPLQIMAYVMAALLMFFPANNDVFAILYGIIILNLATNPKSIIWLDWKPLNYLGKISYGMYMYHGIVAITLIALLSARQITSNRIIYPSVVLGTIAISALSFELFENRFLKLKARFTSNKNSQHRNTGR